MASTPISVVQAGPCGNPGIPASVTPDAVNGNSYPNPGGAPCVLLVSNQAASAITVTFQLPNGPGNGFGSVGTTQLWSVPASTTRLFCLEPYLFNDANGRVNFVVSSSTSVTAHVIQYNRAFP